MRSALSSAPSISLKVWVPYKLLITARAMIVEASGFGKVETPAMGRASDDASKEVTAANAETRAAAKPPKSVSKLINFFNKRSTAGYQNPEVIEKEFVVTPDVKPPHKVSSLEMLSTIGKMSSRLSRPREKQHIEMSNAPNQHKTMANEGDPPWYKPLVSVTGSGMNRMMRQEAQASAPIPENEKRDKVFSSTQCKRLLNMMLSLGSSFSIMDMAHLLKDL